ncbi:MAG: hypothetical protein WAK04_05585, partial [Xanthobacteraceae bacterium]
IVLAMLLRIRAMTRHGHATLRLVTTGHSRSQNSVVPLAYAGGPCGVRAGKRSVVSAWQASLLHGLPA